MTVKLVSWRPAALLLATASLWGSAAAQAVRPAALPTAGVVAGQDAGGKRSVWDGVYTDEQARRGEAHYARVCEACHGADLSGNPVTEIPALVWDAFLTQWNQRTIGQLYEAMKRSMPKDSPGSLNARAYADLVAYLLQANKFPSGTRELSLNPDVLAQIVIERNRNRN